MKTLREAIVVICIAAICALLVNWRMNPSPLPWVHDERPVQSASDTLLAAMMNASSSTNAALAGTASPSTASSIPVATTLSSPALSHKDSVALKVKADSLKKAQHLAGTQSSGTSTTNPTTPSNPPNTATTQGTENTPAALKLPISVSYEQILKLLANPSNVTFIDARKEEEHAKGAFPGSVNVDMIQFPGDPDYRNKSMRTLYSIPKDRIIVAYCGGGNCELSHELCDVLIPMGFKKVFIYLGGWTEYSEKQGLKK